MIGLTPRVTECLAFIKSYMAESKHGSAPTFQEIADGIGLSSKGEAHRLMNSLEARGYVRRLRHRARAIEIVCPDAPRRTTTEIADIICGEAYRRMQAGEKVTIENLRTIIRGVLA